MTTKKFRTDVVLSVVTGSMVARKFSEVHECINHVAGGPVWTHQLPTWWRANESKLLETFQDLPKLDVTGVTGENYAEWFAEHQEVLSREIEVPVIGGLPSSPLEGLDPDKTIVVLTN